MSRKKETSTVDSGVRKLGETPLDFHTLARQAFAHNDWEAAARYFAQCEEQRNAELALINSVQEGLSSQLEMQAIYTLIGDKLRDTFDAQVVMISQYDPQTNMVYHRYAIERGRHLNLTQWSPIDSSRLRIVQTRKPYMINPAEINRLVGVGSMAVVPGTELPKTWLGVPMIVSNQVVGIVSLQNLDKENAFSDSDINLLSALTNSMSQSLENARLYNETQRLLKLLEGEMEIARQTQQSILPMRPPNHKGYDFGSLIISARAVSGDFYDFIPFGRHKMGIVVGDVSDKGLHAALFMALTFSLLRAEAGHGDDPIRTLLNVNRYLLKMNASSMFVTLLFAVLDFRTGNMKYARAGHLPPIVMDGNGRWLELPVDEGQPLGLFPDVMIDQQECNLPTGGLALLFSDGLTEPANTLGEELGLERVRQLLMAHSGEDAQSICEELWLAVQNYSQPIPQQDDFTTVLIKRH
jgi:serine phosphatase RsbU (regulator of sigma subunit)